VDQLLGLLLVLDNQSIQISGSSNLEFGLRSTVLLDGGRLDVLSAGQFQKFLDVLDFLGHCVYLL